MKHLLLAFATLFVTAHKQTDISTLTVNASEFNNNKGKAVVFLYRKNDKIPDSPFKKVSAIIKNKKAIISIESLPYDDYAIILLHDENSNEKIDHSIGLPSEQLGYSNNWKLGFFTGMPSFSKLKLTFSLNEQSTNISITYKKNKK